MITIPRALLMLSIFAASIAGVVAQNPPSSNQSQSQADKEAQADKAFNTANTLLEQRKPDDALVHYKKALSFLPDEPAILFNAGMAAFQSKEYAFAAEVWNKVKTIDPLDWHTRAKLVQVYQAMGKTAERDKERTELFEMWKAARTSASSSNAAPPAAGSVELKDQFQYCRDQFEVKGLKVMAFEHFELKGERALRYVFSILNKTEDDEDFRISLGSYDFTNAVWRETHKPKPKEGERLFHLDGYFKSGSHATYGMYFPEPSYDAMRAKVIQILEAKANPVSSSTGQAPEAKPTPKPTPQ